MFEALKKENSDLVEKLTPSPLYILTGFVFLWRNRVLWKYAAAPLAISFVIFGLSYVLLYHLFYEMLGGVMGEQWYWKVLYYVIIVIAAVLLVAVFFFIFRAVASAIAAPFNDLLSEKTEQLVTGVYSETPFSVIQVFKDASRSIVHSFRILGIYLGLLILFLFLLLIPGLGYPFYTAATILLSSYMLAYEYLGYPLDRRRLSFRQKRAFLKANLRSSLGFGIGNLAVGCVPFVNLLMIPAAVVGGTILYLKLIRSTGTSSPEAEPSGT